MNISEELTVRDFLHVIRRRKKEFVLCWAGIFIGVRIYTACVTPIYRAQALLRVELSDDANRSLGTGPLNLVVGPSQAINMEELLSPVILGECVRRLNHGVVSLSERDRTGLVQQLERNANIQSKERDQKLFFLSVVSPNPRLAAEQANMLAQVIVEKIGEEMTGKARQTKQFIESQIKEVGGKLRASEDQMRKFQQKFGPQSREGFLIGHLVDLKNKRSELSRKFTSSHPEMQQINAEIAGMEQQIEQLPVQEVDIARVSRDVHLNEELYTMLMKRLEENRIMESARLEPVTILEPALEPDRPERPNKPFLTAAGFILGLILAVVVVFVHQHMDTSMVTTEEIEAYLQLPVLATIPHLERRQTPAKLAVGPILRKKRDHLGQLRSRLIFHFPPRSAFVEVYHILRNNLSKNMKEGQSQLYLFTSAVVAEGKSITSANFAVAAAQAGIPTLLVEADLRNPMVDKLFGIAHEPGLTNYFHTSPRWMNYVAGWERIKEGCDALGNAPNVGNLTNLHLLTSGKVPPNPISLLSSERFGQLLKEMRQQFPLVILDGAPAMLFADCSIIGRYVDGVVLIYRFGRTAREALSRTHGQLASSHAKVLGVVVNDMVVGQTSDYEGYYSMYEYYDRSGRHSGVKTA